MPRDSPAQQPPGDLTGFPTESIAGLRYREHQYREGHDDGCWFFSSGVGRWDLRSPFGTCYFGDTPAVAAMERVGLFTAGQAPVPEAMVTDRVVSAVDFTELSLHAAALRAPRAAAGYGITAELSATSNYRLSQQWAQALYHQGLTALTYTPRFSPSGSALALFHEAGPHVLAPVVDQVPLATVLADLQVPVVRTPSRRSLTIMD